MGATVIVTGIPGVGKTTVLRELEAQAKAKGLMLRVVTFGTVLTELFRSSGREIDRDKMRRESIKLQRKIQDQAATEIAKMKRDEILVVDTHILTKTSTGLWAGLPTNVLTELEPDLLVLLEAPPREIVRRRVSDKSRSRDLRAREDVMFDLDWSRSTASACSVLTRSPVRIMRNEEGKQAQATGELLETMVERLG